MFTLTHFIPFQIIRHFIIITKISDLHCFRNILLQSTKHLQSWINQQYLEADHLHWLCSLQYMANYKRIVGEHVVTPPSTDSWVLKISIFFYLNTPINLDRYTKYGLKTFTLHNKKKIQCEWCLLSLAPKRQLCKQLGRKDTLRWHIVSVMK